MWGSNLTSFFLLVREAARESSSDKSRGSVMHALPQTGGVA